MPVTQSARLLLAAIPVIVLSACTPAPQSNQSDTVEQASMSSAFSRLEALAIPAPVVEAKQATFSHHGITVADPYQWLRDPSYPNTDDLEVLAYLNAENQYFKTFLEPHQPLVDKLFEEFKGRVDETESSVPFVMNGFEYRWEYRAGSNYRTRIRKNLTTGEEQVFLDEQALAEGQDYFVLRSWDISPDNRLLIYSVDTKGDERYTAVVKVIETGEILPVDLSNISGSVAFTPDGTGIVYSKLRNDRWMVESVNLRYLEPAENQLG